MSESALYGTWALVVLTIACGIIYGERAAQAAKLVEEHTQAERLACLNSERIWLEPQHLCLIPQGPK